MFNRTLTVISTVSAVFMVPLVVMAMWTIGDGAASMRASFSSTSGRIGLQVATSTRPLNLNVLTSADFGDSDTIR